MLPDSSVEMHAVGAAQAVACAGLLRPVQALTEGFVLEDPAAPGWVSEMAATEAGGDSSIAFAAQQGHAEQIQHRQGFRVGDVGIMIGYQDGSELTEVPDLYYLPHAPAWFLGMANLHGNMLPVFDLAAYLGIAPNAGVRKRMLLVLAHGADAAGVVIDDMPQRLQWTAQQQTYIDTAPDLLAPHVLCACLIEGRLWFDLQAASLLDALEQGMLSG